MPQIIGIASGKGGVGKTTVATNLALAMRDFGKKVLLIDCNLSTPHLAYYLGVSNYKYTLNDALSGKVDIISTPHLKDGIRFIPASLELKDLSGVDAVSLKKHLKKLKNEKYDFIILDSAPGLGREALSVLDAADEIIFVTTPFAPMVNDVLRCTEVLKGLRGAKSIGVVINMITEGSHEILGNTIKKITGLPVIGEIAFDQNVVYGLVLKSPVINYKPDCTASANFRKFAANILGINYKVPRKIKIRSAWRRVKNYFVPQKIVMPQTLEDVRDDIFIQKK